MITVKYQSIDGYEKVREFDHLEDARAWAKYWVGKPEIGSRYAVSGDGVGKITVGGCTLKELFGDD